MFCQRIEAVILTKEYVQIQFLPHSEHILHYNEQLGDTA